ncbi:probable glycosyltransferase 7 [Musa acuminata AAA Group]|uniref:probable glycosyltransferase 7 n=1 Tax=Musa acuminata AAA Group TaxID=214697 RepID=UPI0031E1A09E
MMSGTEPSSPSSARTSKGLMTRRSSKPSLFSDGLVFAGGAGVALLVFWVVSTFFSAVTVVDPSAFPFSVSSSAAFPDLHDRDPPGATFYDDPSVSYTIDRPLTGWDAKRRDWLRLHPAFGGYGRERVLMVTGSQPGPCRNPVGDHLLLRFFKNKVDYCRRHGMELFYNTALLHPAMNTFWAKLPMVRAAMLAHPEADWVWWVDSDAAFTDMDFELPLDRYRDHNLVVHGWPRLVYEARSWVSLNAGVFLIRNCQWSLDFMAVWAATGPMSPDYDRWGQLQKAEFKDKLFNESDDQSALVYLLLKHKDRWGDKIFLESDYYFEGYWVEIVGRLENMTAKYAAVERQVQGLRRRHAEVANGAYGRLRDRHLSGEDGAVSGPNGWRRPFMTHFTGCQPCSGDHNKMYSGESCWEGMQRALHFADDQVLRDYGFRHADPLSGDVEPLPFDYPSAA